MKLELFYAVKPAIINQPFGGSPDYYSKFKDQLGNPEKGHMGVDFQAAHATPLYAQHDGLAWYGSDDHGGDGIYIRTTEAYDYKDGQAFFNIINWHLCSKDDPQFHPLIPCDGTKVAVKAGHLLGYTDNTGAPFESSGDHLHEGLVPTDENNIALEPGNGFNGCIDSLPYHNGLYAQDIEALQPAINLAKEVIDLVTSSTGMDDQTKQLLLSKVGEILSSLLAK